MLRTVTTQVRSSIKGRCSGTLRFNSIFRKRWLSTDASKPKIEVEVKFPFSKAEEDKIQAVSKLISIKRFTDHYFDNNAYALTSKDIWLRLRDGRWECKTSTLDFKRASNPNDKDVSLGDRYHEIEREVDIIQYLRRCQFIPQGAIEKSDLHQLLLENEYNTFCSIETTRKKYQYQDLTIDLDLTNFGYQIGEIEVIVQSQDHILTAEDKIQRFARELGLNITSGVPGKVLTYLQRIRPEHYQALRVCGLLAAKGINN